METAIETWFERDRAHVALYLADADGSPDMNQDAIVEWWDDGVHDAIEDGFLDPRDYHASARDYAAMIGRL